MNSDAVVRRPDEALPCVLVSALRLDAAWSALVACRAVAALRFEPALPTGLAPILGRPGTAAFQLGTCDLDGQVAPPHGAWLSVQRESPAQHLRKLDTLFAPGMAARSHVVGLVLAEAATRTRQILQGGRQLLAAQRPWLLAARDALDSASTQQAVHGLGYTDQTADLPPGLRGRWCLYAAGEMTALSDVANAMAQGQGPVHEFLVSDGDWGWGLTPGPFPSERFALDISPRGSFGLALPWTVQAPATVRWNLRRDLKSRNIAAPLATVGRWVGETRLRWTDRHGVVEVAVPAFTRADPVTVSLSWGTSALLAQEFSREGVLSLDTVSIHPGG